MSDVKKEDVKLTKKQLEEFLANQGAKLDDHLAKVAGGTVSPALDIQGMKKDVDTKANTFLKDAEALVAASKTANLLPSVRAQLLAKVDAMIDEMKKVKKEEATKEKLAEVLVAILKPAVLELEEIKGLDDSVKAQVSDQVEALVNKFLPAFEPLAKQIKDGKMEDKDWNDVKDVLVMGLTKINKADAEEENSKGRSFGRTLLNIVLIVLTGIATLGILPIVYGVQYKQGKVTDDYTGYLTKSTSTLFSKSKAKADDKAEEADKKDEAKKEEGKDGKKADESKKEDGKKEEGKENEDGNKAGGPSPKK